METIYLTDHEMASLVEAIKTAENCSTGEIRVHIDSSIGVNHAEIAFNVFRTLDMDQTKDRNGVLFHVNFEDHYLTIIGDEGIHDKVHQEFWDKMHDRMTAQFKKKLYFQAIKDAILETGQELKHHFPVHGENINELPNEITFS